VNSKGRGVQGVCSDSFTAAVFEWWLGDWGWREDRTGQDRETTKLDTHGRCARGTAEGCRWLSGPRQRWKFTVTSCRGVFAQTTTDNQRSTIVSVRLYATRCMEIIIARQNAATQTVGASFAGRLWNEQRLSCDNSGTSARCNAVMMNCEYSWAVYQPSICGRESHVTPVTVGV